MKCINCHANFEPTKEEEAIGDGVVFCSEACCRDYIKIHGNELIPSHFDPKYWRGKYHVGDDVGPRPQVGGKLSGQVVRRLVTTMNGKKEYRDFLEIPITPVSSIEPPTPRKGKSTCRCSQSFGFSGDSHNVDTRLPSERGYMPTDPRCYAGWEDNDD